MRYILVLKLIIYFSLRYSRISPGWQFKILQIASKVENLMVFAFPVFKMERLAVVIPFFFGEFVALHAFTLQNLI